MTKNDKNIDMFEYDCSENNENIYKKMTKMTKQLTSLNRIAAKIMKTNENDKT